ncbi:MAG: diguanylate cyclase [Anaerolineales bacterium]|nr:diguanylate cyclase [Anaerolineales bacterium]
MPHNSLAYTLALLGAAAIAAWVARISWQRHPAPAARPLAVFLLGNLVWVFTYALYWLLLPAPGAEMWLNATYLGAVISPTAMLVTTLHFTGRGAWLTRRRLGWLLVEPILTLAVMWTDPWHHWFFAGPPPVGAYFSGGLFFWANVVYTYGLVLTVIGLLAQAAISLAPAYRRQAGLLLLGVSVPVFSNLIGFLPFKPWPNLDLTPFAFIITGLVFAAALFRQRLLDLVPIARDVVVERLQDGVLVLDDQDRLADFNRSAQTMLALSHAHLGHSAAARLTGWPSLLERLRQTPDTREEITLPGTPQRYVDASLTALPTRLGRPAGAVLVLRDVTERHQATERLQQQLAEIRALQAQLREQAIRDTLTGLFNRRYLDETLPRELAEAARAGQPLSLAAIDLDHFKAINDSFGHEAGDAVLARVGQLLAAGIRAGDIACRYGGEEFIIVLPGAPLEAAHARVDQWRAELAALTIAYGEAGLRVTFSAGLAGFPAHALSPAGLLSIADQALYQSKAAGRNRVTLGAAE